MRWAALDDVAEHEVELSRDSVAELDVSWLNGIAELEVSRARRYSRA